MTEQMTDRKINISNLENLIPNSLGTYSIKKLRQYFNSKNKTNYTKITQIAKHLKTNVLQAQYDLANEYNNLVDNKQKSKQYFFKVLTR